MHNGHGMAENKNQTVYESMFASANLARVTGGLVHNRRLAGRRVLKVGDSVTFTRCRLPPRLSECPSDRRAVSVQGRSSKGLHGGLRRDTAAAQTTNP